MGLLSIIRKQSRKEREVRLLLLGLDSAGKTTILRRINNEDISSVAPTLGFTIKTLKHRGYTVNLWDVGGQKSLRAYWRNYFERTDALVWVVDSTDTLRMADCKAELQFLLQEERLLGASLLILANKQDLHGAASKEDIAKLLDLESIKSHRWRIEACSAHTGEGLLPGFDWVMSEVSQRIYCDIGQTPVIDSGPFVGLQAFDTS